MMGRNGERNKEGKGREKDEAIIPMILILMPAGSCWRASFKVTHSSW